MKTKIEMSGYEIEIELHEDTISIKAEKDGETVEEMSLPLIAEGETEDEMEDEDDVKSFGDFGDEDSEEEMEEEEMEEEDFEELPMDDEMDSEEEMEDDVKLESFQSYLNKSKKKIN